LKRSQSDRHLSRPSQQVKASQSLLIAANAQIQSVKVHALDGNFWDGQSQGGRRQVNSRLQNIHAPKPILKQTLKQLLPLRRQIPTVVPSDPQKVVKDRLQSRHQQSARSAGEVGNAQFADRS